LTIDGAKIYFEIKTGSINLDQYDEKNAIELFDIAVNMGVATSAKTLQNVEFNE
jgi:lysozyme family protein